MSTSHMDDRLKSLFESLESHVEPPEGTEAAGPVVPLVPEEPAVPAVPTVNEPDVKKGSGAPAHTKPVDPVCPFLKAIWDDSILYRYPHEENACYKHAKPRPVSLSEQEMVCLVKQHSQCAIFLSAAKKKQGDNGFSPILQLFKRRPRR